jgi:DNA-binding Xre family transcriptional regulator
MNEGGAAREPAELAGPGDSALPRTPDRPGVGGAGTDGAGTDGPGADGSPVRLPVLPGFREMALRRMSQDRRRLMRELAGRRQDAGLSQTEIAARMGTSQSAVARLEAGEADVRASTLERYAAALGTEITWKLQG